MVRQKAAMATRVSNYQERCPLTWAAVDHEPGRYDNQVGTVHSSTNVKSNEGGESAAVRDNGGELALTSYVP